MTGTRAETGGHGSEEIKRSDVGKPRKVAVVQAMFIRATDPRSNELAVRNAPLIRAQVESRQG